LDIRLMLDGLDEAGCGRDSARPPLACTEDASLRRTCDEVVDKEAPVSTRVRELIEAFEP
jgi:hypothetical protein